MTLSGADEQTSTHSPGKQPQRYLGASLFSEGPSVEMVEVV